MYTIPSTKKMYKSSLPVGHRNQAVGHKDKPFYIPRCVKLVNVLPRAKRKAFHCFVLFLEMASQYVVLADLKLLGSSDPPDSASQEARTARA